MKLLYPTADDVQGVPVGGGSVSFYRSTMNLQSPEPEAPGSREFDVRPTAVGNAPKFSKTARQQQARNPPASRLHPPFFAEPLELPVGEIKAGELSNDTSPVYDREAIVRSMVEAELNAEAEEELDPSLDDIPSPEETAWPSARRSFNAGDAAGGEASVDSGVFKAT